MKKGLFLILISLTATFKLPACDCEWVGNFVEIASQSQLVALVKIKQYNNYFELVGASPETISQPLSATFEIIEVLSGNEERNEVEVFGDVGNLCRPYIDYFSLDEYYVVALNKSTGDSYENGIKETTNDYVIWNCGEYWLNYNKSKSTVNGYISVGRKIKNELQYAELKEKLRNKKSR